MFDQFSHHWESPSGGLQLGGKREKSLSNCGPLRPRSSCLSCGFPFQQFVTLSLHTTQHPHSPLRSYIRQIFHQALAKPFLSPGELWAKGWQLCSTMGCGFRIKTEPASLSVVSQLQWKSGSFRVSPMQPCLFTHKQYKQSTEINAEAYWKLPSITPYGDSFYTHAQLEHFLPPSKTNKHVWKLINKTWKDTVIHGGSTGWGAQREPRGYSSLRTRL